MPTCQGKATETSRTDTFAAFVGIDWADKEHAICVLDGDQNTSDQLKHSAEAIDAWATRMHQQFGGRPVAVAIEQSRGGLFHALMQYEHLRLFPINPKQAANYRKALACSGAKSDPADAHMLARFLREHHDQLRPWEGDTAETRRIAALCELRRKIVEARKSEAQRLGSMLKLYFPQAIDLVGPLHGPLALELLGRWPTLKKLQRANPKTLQKFFRQHGQRNDEKIKEQVQQIRAFRHLTKDAAIIEPTALYVGLLIKQIEQFNEAIAEFEKQLDAAFSKHEDAAIFRSLPGAGEALAPRLLAAMGSERERFSEAKEVQAYCGIAPVTRRSGQACHVSMRRACPKFIRQTFHEFADQARRWSAWSKAYYEQLRGQGKRHHAAVRALAFKWIRIIFRMWKTRTPYDENRYQQQLQRRNSPLAKYLPSP